MMADLFLPIRPQDFTRDGCETIQTDFSFVTKCVGHLLQNALRFVPK